MKRKLSYLLEQYNNIVNEKSSTDLTKFLNGLFEEDEISEDEISEDDDISESEDELFEGDDIEEKPEDEKMSEEELRIESLKVATNIGKLMSGVTPEDIIKIADVVSNFIRNHQIGDEYIGTSDEVKSKEAEETEENSEETEENTEETGLE